MFLNPLLTFGFKMFILTKTGIGALKLLRVVFLQTSNTSPLQFLCFLRCAIKLDFSIVDIG